MKFSEVSKLVLVVVLVLESKGLYNVRNCLTG